MGMKLKQEITEMVNKIMVNSIKDMNVIWKG